MTTPGGVPNLPAGALTLESIASRLQDMTPAAMRARAADRLPVIFDSSTGGNALNDFTPFGILTQLFAGFNSFVANADPADINGPEDLPGLLVAFIESLPVIGQLVGLGEAVLGTYDGDDEVLLAIQDIFKPIRQLLQLVAGEDVEDFPPTPEEIIAGFENLGEAAANALRDALTGIVNSTPTDLDNWLLDLLTGHSPLNAANIFGQLQMPQLGGGVSITDLTTATANLLQPFTPTSVPTADGWSYDAGEDAAKVIADGTTKTLYLRGVIKVEEGQPLNTSIPVKYSGVTSGVGETIRYVMETYTTPDGTGPATPVTVASITSPSGSAGPVTLGDSSWDIPDGVQSVHPALVVDEAVTLGSIYWKNTPHLHKVLLGVLADGIAQAIQARINELNAMATALLTNPASVLGTLPQTLIDELIDDFNTVGGIFNGSVVGTPAKTWLTNLFGHATRFFRDGPERVLVQQQMATAGGVPPLDAVVKMPYEYLPDDFVAVALGMQWCEVTKTSQSIPASTDTLLTGWSQDGPLTITIASNKFSVPWNGMWNIEIEAAWSGAPTTSAIKLYQNGNRIRTSPQATNVIRTMIPAAATDEFEVYANRTGGSSPQVTATDTFVRITFLGNTTVPSIPILDPVTFDSADSGTSGTFSEYGFNHTFGADGNTLVVPISHTGNSDLVEVVVRNAANTADQYTVPIRSGSTHVGTYFGFEAWAALAAAILPAGVKGETRNVRVRFSGLNAAASMAGVSFNGVGTLGSVVTRTGSGSPNLLVPSNVRSMVAMHFAGMDVNFSGFNRTNDYQVNFSAGSRWAHLIGHAQGGAAFAATNSSSWCAKGIELHP